ncbi:nucleotidyltransferase domain-containing protein [Methylobacterium organophilum]|uniref:Aminoglycoside (3'') (9) adenylyltransferase n=1 Tax=Methylobacterium organophilum TaxID=410 RepID=A0ABQ4TEY3_METOR|nr:nucleotidyltransferase domain-containing protein [Methylobacterium organophilum]GJE28907.1 hypothetical protein LKMONMHP_3782 [Methylobacterium organophilum]
MSRAGVLPAEAEPVLATYLERLAEEHVPAPRGLYLVGSIALGDFRPGASDIDFVAILDEAPSTETSERLARVHGDLARSGSPHFDGVYLPASLLREPAPGEAVMPFSVDGRFRTGELCRELNPAVWRCLARYGRRILGPAPSELGIANDTDVLRAHQIANLHGYWRSWIAEAETALAAKAPGEDCNAAALAWGVLGIGRCACTLATDDIVSKREGGRFGLRTAPVSWHRVLNEALAIHDGGPKRTSQASLRAALAYMHFIIASAPRPQA